MWHPRRRRKQISLLVPIGGHNKWRDRNWHWLHRYWRRCELPHAELVIGHDRRSKKRPWRRHPLPFSKSIAVNNAARRAHGDIYVILDSDAYLRGSALRECASRIRHAERQGKNLWFVPYLSVARLNEKATERLIATDPCNPLRFSTPPDPNDIDPGPDPYSGSAAVGSGREYGAMVTVISAEGFWDIGGMDERFRGWGGEDLAWRLAVDCLRGPAKFLEEDVFHLWHPHRDVAPLWTQASEDPHSPWRTRTWAGQKQAGDNDWLAASYRLYEHWPSAMRKHVDAGHRRSWKWLNRFRRIFLNH